MSICSHEVSAIVPPRGSWYFQSDNATLPVMLYLHVSNRTENLLEHLWQLFHVSKRRDLFEQECFLIQSQGMERMISQTLAERFGSWCNFAFYMPLAFLQYSAEQLGVEITPDGYDRKILVWRLEQLLRDLSSEEFSPLRRYLSGDNGDLKRFQLADQLANIFDQYQVMRPEMLAGWQENRFATNDSAERWQRALWLNLQAQEDGGRHRGQVLQQVIHLLQSGQDFSSLLPERLSVFGLSIMPPLFLRYLQALSLHLDVHLFVLSPCKEYWGDIEGRRRSLLLSLDNVETTEVDMDNVPESHPLLVSLGRQGRDFQRMLFDDVQFELQFDSYEEPLGNGSTTLLKQLQSDLLQGEVTRISSPWPDDDTLQVVSCHSKLREITILKDHILRRLHENPELELRDIIVMAPDIQEYASLIPAVFEQIQHSVSDKSLRKRNPVVAAFDKYLTLFRGRFGWDEILDVLKEEPVATKLHLSQTDLDAIQNWVVASGIRWGLSPRQRREMGLPEFEQCSWEAGLSRLLMGYAVDADEMVDGVLPYTEIEGSGAAALGGLCQFISLIERGDGDFQQRYQLKEWSAILLEHAYELFWDESGFSENKEYLELREILSDLGERQGSFHDGEVDFSVICAWLAYTAGETRSSSGFLRGQLTFCSMLPMRSIPFKVVCLIGLNEGVFPKNDRFATFDLMGNNQRPGDRSRRMDDRYQFLEALVAARESLYLSYIGQSVKNNEKIPPSVVVTELLEVLTEYYQVHDPVVHHPLHPFSRRYFDGSDPRLFSYDVNSCEVALKLQQPRPEADSWWRGSRPAQTDNTIAFADLLRFYSNPQRYFVRNCLGIWLQDDPITVEESETFAVSGLENYLIDQEIVSCLLDGASERQIQRIYEQLTVAGRWPLGRPGKLHFAERTEELKHFARQIEEAGLGEKKEDISFETEVAGYTLHGRLTNIYDNGILLARHARLKGNDLLCGWLHHMVSAAVTGESLPTLIFAKDAMRRFSAESRLLPDLETLVKLFVAGCSRPSDLYIEPGIEWVKGNDKGDPEPLAKAMVKLASLIDTGYDRELNLLMRNTSPAEILGDGFVEVCRTVVQPIWSNVDEC